MAMLGALATTIDKLEPTASGVADLTKIQHQQTDSGASTEQNKGITHHFKLTETHTIEGETQETTKEDDNAKTNEHNQDNKKSKCSCFGFLRMAKK